MRRRQAEAAVLPREDDAGEPAVEQQSLEPPRVRDGLPRQAIEGICAVLQRRVVRRGPRSGAVGEAVDVLDVVVLPDVVVLGHGSPARQIRRSWPAQYSRGGDACTSLPFSPRGSSSWKSTERGHLKWAIRSGRTRRAPSSSADGDEPAAQLDDRLNLLAPLLIRHAEHGHVADRGCSSRTPRPRPDRCSRRPR